jgi:hypothetical protein
MGDYRRVDDSGGWLEVRRIMTVHGARCAIAVGGQPFFVDPLEIDEHARAMYEAAGVPSPVTLERPDLGPTPRTHLFRGLDVYRSADGGVTFAIGGNRETLSASLVRQMAAVAVAMADEAPEAGDVAGFIRAALPAGLAAREDRGADWQELADWLGTELIKRYRFVKREPSDA